MPGEMWESESDSLVVRPVAPTYPSLDSYVTDSSSEDVTKVSDADMPFSCLASITGAVSVIKWSMVPRTLPYSIRTSLIQSVYYSGSANASSMAVM